MKLMNMLTKNLFSDTNWDLSHRVFYWTKQMNGAI